MGCISTKPEDLGIQCPENIGSPSLLTMQKDLYNQAMTKNAVQAIVKYQAEFGLPEDREDAEARVHEVCNSANRGAIHACLNARFSNVVGFLHPDTASDLAVPSHRGRPPTEGEKIHCVGMTLKREKHAFGPINISGKEFKDLRNYQNQRTSGYIAFKEAGTQGASLMSNRCEKGLGESLLIGTGLHNKKMLYLEAGVLDEQRGHPWKFYEKMGYNDEEHDDWMDECLCKLCDAKRGEEPDLNVTMIWQGTQPTDEDGLCSMKNSTNPVKVTRSWFLQPVPRDMVRLPEEARFENAYVLWRNRDSRGTDALSLILTGLRFQAGPTEI